ncbi:MAG TPA: hypothetical protein V6D03_09115 [Candidatus Caenarcaniphilales bacterium]
MSIREFGTKVFGYSIARGDRASILWLDELILGARSRSPVV